MVPAKPVRNSNTPQPSSWVKCIRRIFENDPLIWAKCRKRMRIIAFIPNSSEVVKKLERAREQTSHAPTLMLTYTVTSFRDFCATNFQHTDIPWCPKPQQPKCF